MDLLKLISKIYLRQLEDIGNINLNTLNSLKVTKSYKGCFTQEDGIRFIFIQISTSIYSIQILFLNDSSDTFRDKLAIRGSKPGQDTFNGIPWTWIKTATVA